MKQTKLILFLLLCTFVLHAQSTTEYYRNAEGKTGANLKSALHDIISANQKVLSYDEVWTALMKTDEDPNNSNNVILLYTGWSYPKNQKGGQTTNWNREHTWAKSQGGFGTSKGPGTDIHHLRPTDVTVNSSRGNKYFDNGGNAVTDGSRYGGGSGVTGCKTDGDSWEPRDAVKGDVARMLFYMAVRYEAGDKVDLELAEYSSTSGLHGKLSVLLKWHNEDPVDDWERTRNNKIYDIQNNRNPFIDHPEYVAEIWGGDTYPGDSGNDGDDSDNGNTDTPDDNNDSETTVLFEENFSENNLGNMTAYSVRGSSKWKYGSHSPDTYASMSGYSNGDYIANEDWLINSEAIHLAGYSSAHLSFSTMMKAYNGGTTFKVLISSDYDGSSNPNNFTWTDLSSQASFSDGNWNSVPSGDIDLLNWMGKDVYIAFQFTNTSSASATWEVDDILVTGSVANAVDTAIAEQTAVYPNPTHAKFSIQHNSNHKLTSVIVYNASGRMVKTFASELSTYPVDDLAHGLYLIKTSFDNGTSTIQKLLIQ